MSQRLTFKVNGQELWSFELDRFRQRLGDMTPVWEGIADEYAVIWGREFRLEGAWVRWKPLSPQYRQWKAKNYPGQKILQLSGDLMDSMTNRPFGVDFIDRKVMVIGTQLPYADYHQRGTKNMPARPIIKHVRPSEAKRFAKVLHQYIVTGEVRGAGLRKR